VQTPCLGRSKAFLFLRVWFGGKNGVPKKRGFSRLARKSALEKDLKIIQEKP
jgi:hypothetical protein